PSRSHGGRRQPAGDRGPRRALGHTQKEKTMIFHINRATYKADLSEEQRREGVEMLRQSGAANPAVKWGVVGPELGGEFEFGAVYVVEDLDSYWAYLEFPAHVRLSCGASCTWRSSRPSTSPIPVTRSSARRSPRCRPATSKSTPRS